MKKILILFAIMCFANIASAQKNSSKPYVLSITKGKVVKKDNEVFWEIPVTLTNTTKDTLHYVSMSCSWQDFYTVNTKKLRVPGVDCDKNVPLRLSLPSGKSSIVILSLMAERPEENKPLKFKIGFDLRLLPDEKHWSTDNDYLNEGKNVIWSNEITMP